jgi:hypothetical protein
VTVLINGYQLDFAKVDRPNVDGWEVQVLAAEPGLGPLKLGWIRFTPPSREEKRPPAWHWFPAVGPKEQRIWQGPCANKSEATALLFNHWAGRPVPVPVNTREGACPRCRAPVLFIRVPHDDETDREVACDPKPAKGWTAEGALTEVYRDHVPGCPGPMRPGAVAGGKE